MVLKNDSSVLAQIRNVWEERKKKAQLNVISIGKWLTDTSYLYLYM